MIIAPTDHCWRKVGVTGDRTCPVLADVVHCRNCPVFVAASRALLQREVPDGYAADLQTDAEGPPSVSGHERSYVVFRIWDEWFALPAASVREVATARTIRRVAHRIGGTVLGLTNVRGQLLTCVSLRRVLALEGDDLRTNRGSRLLVAERAGEAWGFPVDEVDGVKRFGDRAIEPMPATVPDELARFHRGLVVVGQARAAVLDPDAVFDALRWSLK